MDPPLDRNPNLSYSCIRTRPAKSRSALFSLHFNICKTFNLFPQQFELRNAVVKSVPAPSALLQALMNSSITSPQKWLSYKLYIKGTEEIDVYRIPNAYRERRETEQIKIIHKLISVTYLYNIYK